MTISSNDGPSLKDLNMNSRRLNLWISGINNCTAPKVLNMLIYFYINSPQMTPIYTDFYGCFFVELCSNRYSASARFKPAPGLVLKKMDLVCLFRAQVYWCAILSKTAAEPRNICRNRLLTIIYKVQSTGIFLFLMCWEYFGSPTLSGFGIHLLQILRGAAPSIIYWLIFYLWDCSIELWLLAMTSNQTISWMFIASS